MRAFPVLSLGAAVAIAGPGALPVILASCGGAVGGQTGGLDGAPDSALDSTRPRTFDGDTLDRFIADAGTDTRAAADTGGAPDATIDAAADRCAPKTCADLAIQCGPAEDGCGGVLHCGDCMDGECHSGVCGTCIEVCRTCAALGIECGLAADGAGGVVDCGGCTFPETCGAGGVRGQCSTGPDGGCVPYTCSRFFFHCGLANDGCGNILDCGTCTPPQTCSGEGRCR